MSNKRISQANGIYLQITPLNQLANVKKPTFTAGQYVYGLSKSSVTHRELVSLFVKATFSVKRRFSGRLERNTEERVTTLPNFKTAFNAWLLSNTTWLKLRGLENIHLLTLRQTFRALATILKVASHFGLTCGFDLFERHAEYFFGGDYFRKTAHFSAFFVTSRLRGFMHVDHRRTFAGLHT